MWTCCRNCSTNIFGGPANRVAKSTLTSKGGETSSSANYPPHQAQPIRGPTSSYSVLTETDDSDDFSDKFEERTDDEVKDIVARWFRFVHPRCAQLWTKGEVQDMLEYIARDTDARDDPICSPDDECVAWGGSMTEKEMPIIEIRKPGAQGKTPTFVTRLLVCFFADNESYDVLKHQKTGAFPMTCNEPACVLLSHVSGYTHKWGTPYNSRTGEPFTPNHMGKTPTPLPPSINLMDYAKTKSPGPQKKAAPKKTSATAPKPKR